MQTIAVRTLWTCIAVFSFQSCYRTTGVQTQSVSIFTITDDNVGSLPLGLESNNRKGDLLLQTNNIAAVVVGDLNTPHRDIHRAYSGGAIIDLTTRALDVFANYTTIGNDSLELLAQGVNLNPDNPVHYTSMEIQNTDFTSAALVLRGEVIDGDGSLASAGASTDPVTGVVRDCYVTTTIEILDTVPIEGSTIGSPVFFVQLTSIVHNQSASDMPIFTVNDHAITALPSTHVFVPYPDWGFERPSATSQHDIAYVPYVHFQPYQLNAAHYLAFSDTDSMVAVRSTSDEAKSLEHTLVGRVGRPGQVIPPGGEITFMRRFQVLPFATDEETVYETAVSRLTNRTRDQHPYSTFTETGELRVSLNFINAPDGWFVAEYRDQGGEYFDGSQWVTLAEGETLPIYGVFNNRDVLATLPVPPGKMQIRAQGLLDEVQVFDHRVDTETDDEGNETQTEVPAEVVVDEIFDLGIILIGKAWFPFQFSVRTPGQTRDLLGKLQVEPLNDSIYSAGNYPTLEQGHTLYLVSSVGAHRFIRGEYRLYMSRGPLFNVNTTDLVIMDVTDDEGNVTTPVEPSNWDVELGPALTVPGYLSADFEVLTNFDPDGLVDIDQTMLMAYAEDLDVIFFVDRDVQPEILTRFMNLAMGQGGYDTADDEAEIDSLYDELVPSRCGAVSGSATPEFPYGRGTYGIMNLPNIDELSYVDMPIVDSGPASLYDQTKAIRPESLVTLLRPRAPLASGRGLFSIIAAMSGLDQQTPLNADNEFLNRTATNGSGTRWLDFDLIEVLSGNRYAEYLLARADWFNLLNAGIYRPAVGGTGNGQAKDILLGVVRTFVAVSDTQIRDNDLQSFWASAAEGHAFVTNGPIIEANISGSGPGDHVTTAAPELQVKLRAAPWIPVNELRVIVDGEVLLTRTPSVNADDETLRLDETISLELGPGSHWVVVEAGEPLAVLQGTANGDAGTFGKIYPGHWPLAFTNPIFIEVSGD